MKRKLLSVLLVLAMALTLLPVSAFAAGETGTVTTITTGGKVSTSGTTTTVTFSADAVLQYAAGDESLGRGGGYHAGILVTAPSSINTDELAQKAKYAKITQWWTDTGTEPEETSWSDPAINFMDKADGKYYIQLWGLVNPEYFGKFGDTTNGKLYYRYQFDWDGESGYDQTVIIVVDSTVKLEKDGTQVWPPEITLTTATLHDTRTGTDAIADENLCKDYSIDTATAGTIKIKATDLKEHQNGNTPATMGYWVGVSFAPAEGYTLRYKAADNTFEADAADGKVNYYWNAKNYQTTKTTTVTLASFKDEKQVGDAVTYTIDFSGVKLYTETPPADPTLTVAAVTGDVDLLGKTAADLQKDISVDGLKVSGTSNYVTKYTGWSSVVGDQEGNYIALKLTTDSKEDIMVKMTDGNKTVTLDEDGILVWKLSTTTDETTKKTTVNPIKVTVGDTEFTIDLNGVTMEAKTVIKPSVDAGGKATATVDTEKTNEAIEAAKSNTAEEDKVLTIDASETASGSAAVKSAEISIPANTVAAIKDAAIPVAIETPVGSVKLPAEAVVEVAKETATASNPAVLVIEPKEDAIELPEGSNDVVAPYDVSVKVDGSPVELKNLTKAIELTLPVPAELKTNKNDIVVVYVETAADGSKTYTIVNSTVDEAGNNVTATTKHLSVYAIMLKSTAVALGAKEETPAGLTLKFAEDKNAIGPKVTAEGLITNGVVTVQVCRTAGAAPAAIFTMTATNDGKVTFNVNSGSVVTVWNGAVTFENGAPKNPPVSVTETATVSSKG